MRKQALLKRIEALEERQKKPFVFYKVFSEEEENQIKEENCIVLRLYEPRPHQ